MKRLLIIKIKDVGIMSLILRNLLYDVLEKHEVKVLTTYGEFEKQTQHGFSNPVHKIIIDLDDDENFDFIDFKIIEVKE